MPTSPDLAGREAQPRTRASLRPGDRRRPRVHPAQPGHARARRGGRRESLSDRPVLAAHPVRQGLGRAAARHGDGAVTARTPRSSGALRANLALRRRRDGNALVRRHLGRAERGQDDDGGQPRDRHGGRRVTGASHRRRSAQPLGGEDDGPRRRASGSPRCSSAGRTFDDVAQRWRDSTPLGAPGGPDPAQPERAARLERDAPDLRGPDRLGSTTCSSTARRWCPVIDAVLLNKLTGGTLLVVSVDRIRKRFLAHALKSLHTAGAHVSGFALNMVPVERLQLVLRVRVLRTGLRVRPAGRDTEAPRRCPGVRERGGVRARRRIPRHAPAGSGGRTRR